MAKIVLDNIVTLERLSKINENFQRIEDYINDKVFSRQSDSSPNYMYESVDFNNKRLLNIPEVEAPTDPVRQIDMESYLEDTFTPYLISEYGLGDGYNPTIWNSKQDVLVSGSNIKTINGASILGSGNIVISGGGGGSTDHSLLTNRDIADQHPISAITGLTSALDSKQATLVSGTSIKTINGTSVLGSGDIIVGGGGTSDHSALTNRNISDQHTIASITSLQSTLDGKASTDVATPSVAGLMAAADKTKLNGVATGATANSSDAALLARGNHTGTQAISTVTSLQSALDGKQPLDGDLTAIAALSSNGVPKRTAADTWSMLVDIKEIVVSTTAPGDTTKLWLDTN